MDTRLDGHLLTVCVEKVNIDYATGVQWAAWIRDLFVQWVWEDVISQQLKFDGIVEIDESLFGRKIKYHRGDPRGQQRIWVVGLVERSSGRAIYYPVADRSAATLLSIIKRHVVPGATIYSDGWVGYGSLNNHGYRHFTVIHTSGFRKRYRNIATGEIISVDTNYIEGSWQGAKAHFVRIHGTTTRNFEAHLCEIMWRNFHKGSTGEVYEYFFQLLADVFYGMGPARLTAPKPLFDTFHRGPGVDDVQIHPIYNVSHAPPDVDAAVQTISQDHRYANAYVSDTEISDSSSMPLSQQPAIPETDAEDQQAGPSGVGHRGVPGVPGLAPATAPGIRHVYMPLGYEEYYSQSDDDTPDDVAAAKHKTVKKKKKDKKGKKLKKKQKKRAKQLEKKCGYQLKQRWTSSDSDFQ